MATDYIDPKSSFQEAQTVGVGVVERPIISDSAWLVLKDHLIALGLDLVEKKQLEDLQEKSAQRRLRQKVLESVMMPVGVSVRFTMYPSMYATGVGASRFQSPHPRHWQTPAVVKGSKSSDNPGVDLIVSSRDFDSDLDVTDFVRVDARIIIHSPNHVVTRAAIHNPDTNTPLADALMNETIPVDLRFWQRAVALRGDITFHLSASSIGL